MLPRSVNRSWERWTASRRWMLGDSALRDGGRNGGTGSGKEIKNKMLHRVRIPWRHKVLPEVATANRLSGNSRRKTWSRIRRGVIHETRTRLTMTPGTAGTCRQPGNSETVWQPVAKHEPVTRILLPDKWAIVCSLQAPPAQRLHLAQRRRVQGVKPSPSNAPDHTLKVAGVD